MYPRVYNRYTLGEGVYIVGGSWPGTPGRPDLLALLVGAAACAYFAYGDYFSSEPLHIYTSFAYGDYFPFRSAKGRSELPADPSEGFFRCFG